ncbi:MAG: hypothetical protein LBC31_00835 [Treponema sp.]|nr:hypothetical protein [Treponema sp.]
MLLLAVLLALSFSLHAQETAALRLYYIKGNEITLTVAGRGQIYSEYDFPDTGAALAPGDIVMIGRESSAELQLLTDGGEATDEYVGRAERSGPLVKLTEGSTLRFVSFANGTATLEILYGQLRVVSAAADYRDGVSLRIRAGNAMMNVSGGDFNVDYMIHPGESLIERGRNGSLRLQVYSFRGTTDIVLSGSNSTSSFAVNEYERVAIEAGSTRSVIERKPLDPAILAFWESMPFAGKAPGITPDTTLPGRGSRLVMNENGEERYVVFPIIDSESAALVRSRTAGGDDETPLPPSGNRKKLTLKNAFLITGTVLSGIGLGANLYGLYGNGPPGEMAANYGYISLGLGVVSLIVACIINPKIP